MSRVGRKPVAVPDKVKIEANADILMVSGPLGSLKTRMPKGVGLTITDGQAVVSDPPPARGNRGYRGLVRALLANMVDGVTKGYSKTLEINGVGYKAEQQGETLTFNLGYSHSITLKLPQGINAEVNKAGNNVKISGIDKQMVGQIAAKIRAYKIPEPYKAKGVKYADETLRRKVGKAGAK